MEIVAILASQGIIRRNIYLSAPSKIKTHRKLRVKTVHKAAAKTVSEFSAKMTFTR